MNSFSKKPTLVTNEELREQVLTDLHAIKVLPESDLKIMKLKELAKACMNACDWNLSWNVIQIIADEKIRNLMIANLIEEYLIPAHEYAKAKEFSKYLTSDHEITTLIFIRLAIIDGNLEQAYGYVELLPTPLSRNYALNHIVEAYLSNGRKAEAIGIGKQMVENARTCSNASLRNFLLRDIAKNVFLANGEKELACEIANYIGDNSLKECLLKNIKNC